MLETYNLELFGIEMKKIRLKLKISQKKLENSISLSRDTIRRIERGEVVPRYDTLIKLSSVFRIDMIQLFQYHTTDNELLKYYNEIDHILIYNDLDRLDSLRKEINHSIGTQLKDFNPVYTIEFDQFIILCDTLLMINDFKVNSQYIIDDSIRLIKIKYADFTVNKLEQFNFSFIEIRALILLSLGLSEVDIEGSTNILMYICEDFEHDSLRNNHKLYLKVLLNLSTNYYQMENDNLSLKYANRGIQVAMDLETSYLLSDLLFRKGIALYYLDDITYNIYIKKALDLCDILNRVQLKNNYLNALRTKHNIQDI